MFLIVYFNSQNGYGQINYDEDLIRFSRESEAGPRILDPALKVEEVVGGLELPTSMAFLGTNDILVLEKQKGTVQRILNGNILPEPVLDVNVANENERGMLGIAVTKEKNENNSQDVFLTFTESEEDGSDSCTSTITCEEGQGEPYGHRLYKYELLSNKLVNPTLLLDLPATPGPAHNGGAVTIGPDNNLYIVIGDVRGPSQNPREEGKEVSDGRSGILRLTQDGQVVGDWILSNEYPLNLYYAYGIRNSFGMDFDPVTGKLWDTENGGASDDEINLVEPGFNSGWKIIQGIGGEEPDNYNSLVHFDGKGKYSEPEFVWVNPVGPTALTFLDSDKYGIEYENDMFVGDVHRGYIYHFDLDQNRTGLVLDGPIEDKVADNEMESEGIIFGHDFGGITDIEVGPDGYLYIVSIGLGKIFRLVPV